MTTTTHSVKELEMLVGVQARTLRRWIKRAAISLDADRSRLPHASVASSQLERSTQSRFVVELHQAGTRPPESALFGCERPAVRICPPRLKQSLQKNDVARASQRLERLA
jgi:hypothetical protein